VPGSFDSLMAKLIVTGATREQAIARARRALAEFRIEGVASVLPFHRAVVDHADFTGGEGFKVHTRWIETEFASDLAAAARPAPMPATALHRTAMEIDGRRVALGLPAEWLRGLQSAAAVDVSAGSAKAAPPADAAAVTAPVAGTIRAWKREDDAEVAQGEVVAVMEAMKMEMQVCAHRGGRMRHGAQVGAYLEAGATMARIATTDAS